MKEATGELSMTVIVIVGAIAIAGIVGALLPSITNYVKNKWQGISGETINVDSGKKCTQYSGGKCTAWSE